MSRFWRKSCASERCTSVPGVATQFQAGRQAFLVKDYVRAAELFEKVAKAKADYVSVSANFRQTIWSYLGRAQYGLRDLRAARRSLERAMSANDGDGIARLYFGLTLLRENYLPGAQQTEAALKALHSWIEQANASSPGAALWDPQREIRREIEKTLADISNRAVNVDTLIASGEWIGERMEAEMDQVKRDESRRFNNEF